MAAKEATKGHWDREQEQPKGNNNPRCDDHQKQEEGKNEEVTMDHPLDESSDGSKEGGGVWESEWVCERENEIERENYYYLNEKQVKSQPILNV